MSPRSNAPSATVQSHAHARRARRPRSARAGSSDPPSPCGGEARRRRSVGTRGSSGGRPSTGSPSRSSFLRSDGCRASPGAVADASPATRPGERGASSDARVVGAGTATGPQGCVRRRPAGVRGSRSASAECLHGSGGCGGAKPRQRAVPRVKCSFESWSSGRSTSSPFPPWSSECRRCLSTLWRPPPQWPCLRTRAAARRPG
jgi:hypothetical protein